MRLNRLFLCLLSSLALNACVSIPNVTACTAAGKLSAGAICAETMTSKTSDMTLDQYIGFLEPNPGASGVPPRGGAICQSADDYNKIQTALEQACRELGAACSADTQKQIQSLKHNTPKAVVAK